ncbi:MAG: hypothetical protein KDA20_07500 [Phycisphaerales bacterium]|nr:hypothetical protein [Phycisphaerales bacterium]
MHPYPRLAAALIHAMRRIARRPSLVVLTLACSAHAQHFNLDFGPGSHDRPSDTYGAATGQLGYWNGVNADAPNNVWTQLRNLDGALTNARARVLYGSGSTGCIGGFFSINWGNLMCDQVAANGEIEIDIDGLEPGIYEVTVYAGLMNQPFADTMRAGGDGSFAERQLSGTISSASFVHGRTHARLLVQVIPDRDLYVGVRESQAAISAVQITKLRLAACEGDLNGDNVCNLDDLQLLLFYFGNSCP